jgi:signal transduction histidine kinase
MDALKPASGPSVPLESVLRTEELKRRPSRPPDYRAENQALLALAQELTNSPSSVLQRLVDTALELCRAHSAGISLLEEGPPGGLSPSGDHFRWHAVAGQWTPLVWNTTTPRDNGPCGTVLDRNITLLFSNAHRYYTQFAGVLPFLVEGLLVPFHVDGQAVGTVWVIAHDETRKFDAEDQRLLESLATFAAIAYQARVSISAQAKANRELQAEIAERERAEGALREAERKRAADALREVQMELAHANRLATMGHLAASIAHEVNQPIGATRNNAHAALRFLAGDPPDLAEVREALECVVNDTYRAGDIIGRIRDQIKKVPPRKEEVDLNEAIEEVIALVRGELSKNRVSVQTQLAERLSRIHGDRVQLQQVMLNLILNAIEAMIGVDDEVRELVICTEASASEDLLVTVGDSGPGVAADDRERIFESFYTTKASGVGIGLSICRSIIDAHGGQLWADANHVRGAVFRFTLPAGK